MFPVNQYQTPKSVLNPSDVGEKSLYVLVERCFLAYFGHPAFSRAVDQPNACFSNFNSPKQTLPTSPNRPIPAGRVVMQFE
jgi:hypothetical protein